MSVPSKEDVAAYSYDELFELYHRVKAELDRKRLVREAEMQLKDLTERYKSAISDVPAKDIKDLPQGSAIGPGGKLIIDGVEWTNSSGAFLSPHTAGPSQYPQGWQRTGASAPNPATVPLWKIDTHYNVGDEVNFAGKVFKCLQAHKSQSDWTPPVVPALWATA